MGAFAEMRTDVTAKVGKAISEALLKKIENSMANK